MTDEEPKQASEQGGRPDAEGSADLIDPVVRGHVDASRAEKRAGRTRPAEKLQADLDATAKEGSEREVGR